MCLILLSYHCHQQYPVIIAANRDEFYDRRTVPAGFWEESPDVLAGKDLQGGGTWLGVSKSGRIAMITNYREAGAFNPDAPTRGRLVSDFLFGAGTAQNYLERLKSNAQSYNGFSLICGDDAGFYYFSNRSERIEKMSYGIFGLSNHLLDTSWPKVSKSKKVFSKILEEPVISEGNVFTMLSDTMPAEENLLPDTGVGVELEKILSSVFIKSPKYGTRCLTLVLVDQNSQVHFVEKTYEPVNDQWSEVRYEFALNARL